MFLNLTSTPKIAPKDPKRAKKAPNLAEVKAKRSGCTMMSQVIYEKLGTIKHVPMYLI